MPYCATQIGPQQVMSLLGMQAASKAGKKSRSTESKQGGGGGWEAHFEGGCSPLQNIGHGLSAGLDGQPPLITAGEFLLKLRQPALGILAILLLAGHLNTAHTMVGLEVRGPT